MRPVCFADDSGLEVVFPTEPRHPYRPYASTIISLTISLSAFQIGPSFCAGGLQGLPIEPQADYLIASCRPLRGIYFQGRRFPLRYNPYPERGAPHFSGDCGRTDSSSGLWSTDSAMTPCLCPMLFPTIPWRNFQTK